MPDDSAHPIVIFDGECNLCEASVRFIIPRDSQGRFRFAPSQTATGQALLERFNLNRDAMLSVILIDDNRALRRSDAALAIARRLDGLWPLLYMFRLVPRSIRDYLYDFVARNRYRWFGQKATCVVPSADIMRRFLP